MVEGRLESAVPGCSDLGSGPQIRLVQHGVYVILDRRHRDEQRLGDLSVREPRRNERCDLELSWTESVEPRIRPWRHVDHRFGAPAIDGNVDTSIGQLNDRLEGQLGRSLSHGVEQHPHSSSRLDIGHDGNVAGGLTSTTDM